MRIESLTLYRSRRGNAPAGPTHGGPRAGVSAGGRAPDL